MPLLELFLLSLGSLKIIYPSFSFSSLLNNANDDCSFLSFSIFSFPHISFIANSYFSIFLSPTEILMSFVCSLRFETEKDSLLIVI